MKKCKWLALLMLIPLVLTSCAELLELGFLTGTSSENKYEEYFEGISPVRGDIKIQTPDVSELNLEYSERELSANYDKSLATRIVFADSGSTVYGKGAETDGKDVVISAAGTYIISGSASGALLTVKTGAEDEVHLVLSGLSLVGKSGTALDLRTSTKLILTLEGENSLSDSIEDKPSALNKKTAAVIHSRESLTINGTGSLSVSGGRSHGIASEGELSVTGGRLNIYTSKAGLVGESCVKIGGGEHSIKAEEEGILSGEIFDESYSNGDNTMIQGTRGFVYISGGVLDIVSTGDALHAESLLLVKDGMLDLTTGVRIDDFEQEEEAEETLPDFWDVFEPEEKENQALQESSFTVFSDGLYAASDVMIFGGTLAINASNHTIYAEGSLCIDGGKLLLRAVHSGLCAGGALGISDGVLIVENSRTGITAENVDISGGYVYVGETNCGLKAQGAFRLSGGVLAVAGAKNLPLDFGVATATGGVLVALGNADVAREFFPSENQGVIYCKFKSQGDGYPLSLCDNEGRVILSLEGKTEYSCAYLSIHEIVPGSAYALMSGGYVSSADRYGFAMSAPAPIAAEALAVVTATS